jgi:two-component system CheB/CheR fusion protein
LPLQGRGQDAVDDLSAISGQRILIIEDNDDVRESLRLLVELRGNEVVTASDAAKGLEAAASFIPDVVICDIGQPDVDGFELIRSLRLALSGRATRFVAWSGYGRVEDIDRALDSGFDSFVVKSLRPRRGDDASSPLRASP